MKGANALCLVLLGLLAGCSDDVNWVPATQTIVTVRSDLGGELASIDATVYDAQGTKVGDSHSFALSQVSLPISFTVYPARSSTRSFLLVLTGRDANQAELVTTQAIANFMPQKTLGIELWLRQICKQQSCAAQQTCSAALGAPADCVPIPTLVGHETVPGQELDGQVVVEIDHSEASDGSTPAASMDGAPGDTVGAMDGGMDAGAYATQPDAVVPGTVGPDCDDSHPCSAGFACKADQCVSACASTQCDPNATCALVAGAPVCSCRADFISMMGAGGSVTCVRDKACSELGCDANASCQVGSDQLRHCQCKPGFTGEGTRCTAVTCPALSLANGKVSGGMAYGATASFSCNAGYKLIGANVSRSCGLDGDMGVWSGSAPTCEAVDCLAPPKPAANGSVATPQGTKFGAVANYSCGGGYTVIGDLTRNCQADGTWSGSVPRCELACGNGKLEPTEACDPTAWPWSSWSCATNCQVAKFYNACDTTSSAAALQCASNNTCQSHVCAASCQTNSDCFGISGSPLTPICASGYCMLTGCTRGGTDCPTGTICSFLGGGSLPDGGSFIVNGCMGCSTDTNCPSGKRCHLGMIQGSTATTGLCE